MGVKMSSCARTNKRSSNEDDFYGSEPDRETKEYKISARTVNWILYGHEKNEPSEMNVKYRNSKSDISDNSTQDVFCTNIDIVKFMDLLLNQDGIAGEHSNSADSSSNGDSIRQHFESMVNDQLNKSDGAKRLGTICLDFIPDGVLDWNRI